MATPILESGGALHTRLRNEPRLSRSQVDALQRVAKADHKALVVGLDQKMRPIVKCRRLNHAGAPMNHRWTEYSLLRNGDPAKPITPIHETW